METTTLPNGIRVSSTDTYGQACCINVFLDTGSKYETVRGVASHLEKLAGASTLNRSQSQLVADLDDAGAAFYPMTTREQVFNIN